MWLLDRGRFKLSAKTLAFPAQIPPYLKFHILPYNTESSKPNKIYNIYHIPKAITDLES